MDEDRITKFQHFFEADVKLKNLLMTSAPPPLNDARIDDYDIKVYLVDLKRNLDEMFIILRQIAKEFFGVKSSIYNSVGFIERKVRMEYGVINYKIGYDLNRIHYFYDNYVSLLRPDFLYLIQDRLVGGSLFGFDESLVHKATTVNELLHFMHSYILNNDFLLQSIPEIKSKQNNFGYSITLRGVDSTVFRNLFEQFPIDIDVGYTDMVAVNDNKLLMMVKDRGHALTIEISLIGNIARIEYFIPKICNVGMVNDLPGLYNKVDGNSVAATGAIEVPVDELPNTLYDFISRVPMDHDMDGSWSRSVA